MFAYIKLIAENKFDTIPFALIHNYDKIPLPPNKNKQYFVHYKNEEPKLAVLIYVEETITELEKLIASRRIIVPALRNQETASEMSDNNESNSKPKATLSFEINPSVNQQLEQLRAKLAIIDGDISNDGNYAKENVEPTSSEIPLQEVTPLKQKVTSPKQPLKEQIDSSVVKVENEAEKIKRRRSDSLNSDLNPNKKSKKNVTDKKTKKNKKLKNPKKLKKSSKEMTLKNSSYASDSGQLHDDKSIEPEKIPISPNNGVGNSILSIKSDANSLLSKTLETFNVVEENGTNNSISSGNDSQQSFPIDTDKTAEVHEIISRDDVNANAAIVSKAQSEIDKCLGNETSQTTLERSKLGQSEEHNKASCSFTQPQKVSSKDKQKSTISKRKHTHDKNSKAKKKTGKVKDKSKNDALKDIRKQLENLEKSQEAFQQVVTAALQTIVSNWQQFQSTRATIPTAVQAIDLANIQVPPPVGFIRSDTGMIHCGQNVWITVQNYNNAKAAAGTDAIFVKNIAVDIFTREVLKSSSVTGKVSNRTKAPAKPKLDSNKMLAVRDIYRYYLKEHRQLSEDEINAKIDDYIDYILVKISDLERPKKSTRSEGSDKKEDGKKKIRNNRPASKKKEVESSSEGTSFSESNTDSEEEEESADSKTISSGDERTLN